MRSLKMIFPSSLRNTFLFSVISHITVFSLFSFSFGPRIKQLNFADASFYGAILGRTSLIETKVFNGPDMRSVLINKSSVSNLAKISNEYPLTTQGYLKPQSTLTSHEEKIVFMPEFSSISITLKRKEPIIMLYPRLPYHFALYFKDRQTVHIELEFNLRPQEERSQMVIKRKISSGNLEVDLLSMRYISRYLFIQKMGFTPDGWHTVKIDFSAEGQ
jgi:hypothetical protein